ncbi:MAG: TlpA disulfide reductase family protein [Thauera sp.]|jgi:thiol-disulfide isomerase/thioredoxin|nr:TlpA disulfide reductase family protein [Thauera sp.]
MLRLFCLLLFSVSLTACSGSHDAGPRNGSSAPAFEAYFTDGSVRRFPEDFAGKPVVIDFWADWCQYCPDSMQRLDRARQQHRADGLEVLAVNVGQSADTARHFLSKIAVSYAAVLDPGQQISKDYGIRGLPVSYFIDREGRVAGRILGGGSDQALSTQLQRILPTPAP